MLKMATSHGRCDFCVVFTMRFCPLELKQLFSFSNHTALISDAYALRSYLKLICGYGLHMLTNTKFSPAKDHSKNYIQVRPPVVHYLLCNGLLRVLHCFRMLDFIKEIN